MPRPGDRTGRRGRQHRRSASRTVEGRGQRRGRGARVVQPADARRACRSSRPWPTTRPTTRRTWRWSTSRPSTPAGSTDINGVPRGRRQRHVRRRSSDDEHRRLHEGRRAGEGRGQGRRGGSRRGRPRAGGSSRSAGTPTTTRGTQFLKNALMQATSRTIDTFAKDEKKVGQVHRRRARPGQGEGVPRLHLQRAGRWTTPSRTRSVYINGSYLDRARRRAPDQRRRAGRAAKCRAGRNPAAGPAAARPGGRRGSAPDGSVTAARPAVTARRGRLDLRLRRRRRPAAGTDGCGPRTPGTACWHTAWAEGGGIAGGGGILGGPAATRRTAQPAGRRYEFVVMFFWRGADPARRRRRRRPAVTRPGADSQPTIIGPSRRLRSGRTSTDTEHPAG